MSDENDRMSTAPDTLELCASDLQNSARYDNYRDMRGCSEAVALRVLALAATNRQGSATTGGSGSDVVQEPPILTLNGYQLREALEFVAPDETDEQMQSEVCIQYGPARTHDEGTDEAGMYCWPADYPDEGSICLDDEPSQQAAPVVAAADDYPPMLASLLPALRRIRRCENEAAAQIVLENALFRYVDADRAARGAAPAVASQPIYQVKGAGGSPDAWYDASLVIFDMQEAQDRRVLFPAVPVAVPAVAAEPLTADLQSVMRWLDANTKRVGWNPETATFEITDDEAFALVTSFLSPPEAEPAVAAGCALVPMEPDHAMAMAGQNAMPVEANRGAGAYAVAVFKAMIAAAPHGGQSAAVEAAPGAAT